LLLAQISALAVPDKNTLITLALLPQTFIIANQVRSGATGPALIPLLGKTGELQIIFAFLLALALVMY
jgi:1,4-dihydroxy-2-naphthoate octaprenyltransferase